jgi:two-component system cell cycle response regulator
MRALLIEDNAADALLIREALTPERNVSPAVTLECLGLLDDGLERVRQGGIDAVLLALTLPDSRGLETVDRLREVAPDIPLVALIDYDDEAFGRHAIQRGAQEYLVKGALDDHLIVRTLRYAVERQRLHATLRELSLADELTGLYNLRGFSTIAEHHLRLAQRTRGLLLVLVSLEGLAHVNGSLGRREGDRAIVATAELLRGTFRASDLIGRLSGHEFGVLVLDAADETANIVSRRVRTRVTARNAQAARPFSLSLRLGTRRFEPGTMRTLDELIVLARESLPSVAAIH